jgi:DNA-binding transcriptional ArsR family regulator
MIEGDPRTRRILACLGDPSRFKLVASLQGGTRCVTDLATAIGLSQSCTTRHLQALRREGLVSASRDGKRVLFRLRLDEPGIAELIAWARAIGSGDESAPFPDPGSFAEKPPVLRPPPSTTRPETARGSSPRVPMPTPARSETGVEAEPAAVVPPARSNGDNESSVLRRSDIEDFLL